MPIYEYQCTTCGALFEAIQKINDAPLTHCEACGQASAKRLVSAPGFQLKGTGWYATDFKDKPKSSKATSEKTPDASSKPAAPPEKKDAK